MTQQSLHQAIHQLVREDFHHQFGQPKLKTRPDPVWAAVRATGTRLWLDTGDLDEASRLWNTEFEALTTNNTLLNKEVQKGIYDDLVRKSAALIRRNAPSIDTRELLLEIAFILNARHGLRLVEQFDAFVSVELHTDLADEVEKSVEYGRRYHAICPERFYVKVPLTPAGLLAARRLHDLHIPVNLTLGFSARQNYLVAVLSRPVFVNVFMGRLNSFVADNHLGDGRNVGEKATLSTQREILRLRSARRSSSLLIGASVRDPAQIPSLAGVDVLTMPTKVAAAYHQAPAQRVSSQVNDDPPVALASGTRTEDFNGGSLWDVSDAFRAAADKLSADDPAALNPDEIVKRMSSAGFAGLFPAWTDEQRKTAQRDGKLPIFPTWRDSLSSGRIGLDALMNLSALESFATDQKALDDRVRSLL